MTLTMRNHSISQPRVAETRDLIEQFGPISTPDIAEKMGIKPNTVGYYVEALYDAHEIHIGAWKGFGVRGSPARLWAIGNLSDVRKPTPEERVRAPEQAEKWELALAARDAQRLSYLAAQLKPFRHWQDIALFGEAA